MPPLDIRTDRLPTGEWIAWENANYEPGDPHGYGETESLARADLDDKLGLSERVGRHYECDEATG